MDWAQILVIILSIFLALFLLAGITLLVMLINITRQIKQVASSAQRTADQVERTVSRFSNATSSAYLVNKLTSLFKKGGKK